MRWLIAIALAACSSSTDPPPDAPRDAPIDAPPDAADPCLACLSDEICIERFDGTCRVSAECTARTTECPNNACSPACEAAYCGSPYQCQNRPPCGGESPLAFTCYGP